MEPTVTACCLQWHLDASHAFEEILFAPLRGHAEVRTVVWDGKSPVAADLLEAGSPLVFCQLAPPPDLLAVEAVRAVWVPMWDDARRYSAEWWSALPKTLRVVAYSRVVAEMASSAGLPTLHVRYFPDPRSDAPARWDDGPVIYYWNRTGLFGPRFLKKLASKLGATAVLFRPDLDPRIPDQMGYRLPSRLGDARVEVLPGWLPHSEYLEAVGKANVLLAPRGCEGVGLLLLEAMARGCAVFAVDAPAANEYVEHGRTGFLLRPLAEPPSPEWRFAEIVRQWYDEDGHGEPGGGPASALWQEWRRIRGLDLEQVGAAARAAVEEGFARWRADLPRLARFILDW